MWFWCYFIVVIWNILLIEAADTTLATKDKDGRTCVTKIEMCKLKADYLKNGRPGEPGTPGVNGTKGEQGEPGTPGVNGTKGEQGEPGTPGVNGTKGEQGEPGTPGVNGTKGEQGEPGTPGVNGTKGEQGEPGTPGVNGTKGEQGEPGTPGVNGAIGEQGNDGAPGIPGEPGTPGVNGTKGEQGSTGPRGPPGLPGKAAACVCEYAPTGPDSGTSEGASADDAEGLEEAYPAADVCKALKISESGTRYIGPESMPIKVKCDVKEKHSVFTCLTPKSDPLPKTPYQNETNPFWASEKNISLVDTYMVTTSKLLWLQAHSSSVHQTIRYHCMNSIPFSKDDIEKSLLMLSWNDFTFGPMPSATSSFYYSVPLDTDGCSKPENADKWSHTDIILSSNFVRRLPVTDLFIRDIRRKDQAFRLEIKELCFG